jgi:diguanylate cyclase (GGDEF)-like protein
MFDAEQRLVVCNANYARMYNLPPELIRPGTTLQQILNDRMRQGLHPKGGEDAYVRTRMELAAGGRAGTDIVELENGRVLSIVHQPMADGGWVSTHQDITEERRTQDKIRYLARHDSLTGLPNRVQFREAAEKAEGRIGRGDAYAVLAIDVDHFKLVNDGLGHGIGDEVLCRVAGRLRECCRNDDTVARLGGDEFAVLTGRFDNTEGVAALAARIVSRMAQPIEIDGHNVLIGASIGIAVAPADGRDTDELLRNADLALYRAKTGGRGGYYFFEKGMDALVQRRRELEIALRQALAAHEFRLVFQPLINLEEGKICAVEALLRWDHPERGSIPPAEFIPVAEESGLIVSIGEWVLHEACLAAAKWPDDVNVAVNLSTVQFRHRSLLDQVKSALRTSGVAPRRLELEVTESLLLADSEATLAILHELRGLGVRISMDDFGTGYSSLSYLRSFPFDKIKIDRSFVNDLSAAADSRAIVNAVIGLGHSLGMSTTAEGIETEAQLELVRAQGCTEVQGFLFSPPLPATALDKLLTGNAAADWDLKSGTGPARS